MTNLKYLENLAKLLRYYIIKSTTVAGSGHLSSSLSAVELMVGLFFGGVFRFDGSNPQNINNDRIIFSKGHASPLFYSLWAAAGLVTEEELLTLRRFTSRLEGHPTMEFPYTEAATGSLGQGLSVGVGFALNAKYVDKLPYRTYVLLGDSEMAEGSVWEAIEIAAYYKLDNLVAVVDVNRLGQRGETMIGHKLSEFQKRFKAFGWETIILDGHDLKKIIAAYKKAMKVKGRPVAIIAKTFKGRGVKMVENKEGWHGKPLAEEEAEKALKALGVIDVNWQGEISSPKKIMGIKKTVVPAVPVIYKTGEKVAVREAYGNALASIGANPKVVVLDAEVSNSTFSEKFKKVYPKRFFEMFIAEQNMVGTALGFSRVGKIPFASTFGAFFTRAFDQIRMSAYSLGNIKFCGSHVGVSIGPDGVSQMGLEDIALFRSVFSSVVLYPADAVSTQKLVEEMVRHDGICYLRSTREATPVIYGSEEKFFIGGSKILKRSDKDIATIVAAGITVFEALKAYEELSKRGIAVRVIDLYSIKPLDQKVLEEAARETDKILVVEDHYAEGGMAEAIRSALGKEAGKVISLAVRKMPHSGKSNELLAFEEISAEAIVKQII